MENNAVVLKKETTDIVLQATTMTITNQEQYEVAANDLKMIKGLQKRICETFDPIVKAAKATHTEALAKKKAFLDPAVNAENITKRKMIGYTTEQERLQAIEEEKLRKAAEAEERRKKKIIDDRIAKAKAAGKEEKVAELEEKKEGINIEAPVLAPRTEKVKGVSYKERWFVKSVDKTKLPIDYLEPNMSMLNKYAQATKGKIPVPGVAFDSKKEMASSSL